jgi:hypothetical protein
MFCFVLDLNFMNEFNLEDDRFSGHSKKENELEFIFQEATPASDFQDYDESKYRLGQSPKLNLFKSQNQQLRKQRLRYWRYDAGRERRPSSDLETSTQQKLNTRKTFVESENRQKLKKTQKRQRRRRQRKSKQKSLLSTNRTKIK